MVFHSTYEVMNYGLNVKKSQLFVTTNPEMALPVILKNHDGGDFLLKILGQNFPFVIINQKL